MAVGSLVRLDPAAGFAFIGEDRIPLEDAGRAGELRVGGAGGPVLRAPTFGERSRIAWRAIASTDARTALARGLLHVMTETEGVADALVLEVVALVLAGGDRDGPPFTRTALDVARASGMDITSLDALDATEVDRLAVDLAQPAASEWQSFVLESQASEAGSIRDRLADRLLQRADPQRTEGDTTAGHARAPFDASGSGESAADSTAGQPDRSPGDQPPPSSTAPGAAKPDGVAQPDQLADAPGPSASPAGPLNSPSTPPVRRPARADVLARAVSRPVDRDAADRSPAAPAARPGRPSLRVATAVRSGATGWRVSPDRNVAGSAVEQAATSSPSQSAKVLASATGTTTQATDTTVWPSPTTTHNASAATRDDANVFAPDNAAATRAPITAAAVPLDHDAIADELAQRLDDEAALRGVFR